MFKSFQSTFTVCRKPFLKLVAKIHDAMGADGERVDAAEFAIYDNLLVPKSVFADGGIKGKDFLRTRNLNQEDKTVQFTLRWQEIKELLNEIPGLNTSTRLHIYIEENDSKIHLSTKSGLHDWPVTLTTQYFN